MRKGARTTGRSQILPLVAIFIVLAVALDGIGVAATYKAGFQGIVQLLLASTAVVVGTACAYALATQCMHLLRNRRGT